MCKLWKITELVLSEAIWIHYTTIKNILKRNQISELNNGFGRGSGENIKAAQQDKLL